jgi:hypothetical protein
MPTQTRISMRQKWFDFLISSGVQKIDINRPHWICEEHFEKHEMIVFGVNREKQPVWNAVPTIYTKHVSIH